MCRWLLCRLLPSILYLPQFLHNLIFFTWLCFLMIWWFHRVTISTSIFHPKLCEELFLWIIFIKFSFEISVILRWVRLISICVVFLFFLFTNVAVVEIQHNDVLNQWCKHEYERYQKVQVNGFDVRHLWHVVVYNPKHGYQCQDCRYTNACSRRNSSLWYPKCTPRDHDNQDWWNVNSEYEVLTPSSKDKWGSCFWEIFYEVKKINYCWKISQYARQVSALLLWLKILQTSHCAATSQGMQLILVSSRSTFFRHSCLRLSRLQGIRQIKEFKEIKETGCAWKISGKRQGILLMLETIVEINLNSQLSMASLQLCVSNG